MRFHQIPITIFTFRNPLFQKAITKHFSYHRIMELNTKVNQQEEDEVGGIDKKEKHKREKKLLRAPSEHEKTMLYMRL